MQRFRTNDAVRLTCTDAGSGWTVVLVHGFTAPATAWALTEDALLEAGYRVVAFDRRAHGESETPMFGQRMSRHGRDLAELLEHLDLQDVVLVGASGRQHPLGVRRPVRHVGARRHRRGRPDAGDARLDRLAVRVLRLRGRQRGHLLRRRRPPDRSRPRRGCIRRRDRPAVPAAGRSAGVPRQPGSGTLGLLQDHAVQDWRDVVTRAGCPVLMVAGRDNQLWPCEHAAAAVADNPLGRSVVIEDAGHTVSFDQPDAFNAVLLEFLEDLDR